MNERIEVVVHGQVQMVMYRDFTSRKAKSLGVVGEVQNMSDGTVRVVAEGTREALDRFVRHLRTGPMRARVERVEITNVPATDQYTTFSIVL